MRSRMRAFLFVILHPCTEFGGSGAQGFEDSGIRGFGASGLRGFGGSGVRKILPIKPGAGESQLDAVCHYQEDHSLRITIQRHRFQPISRCEYHFLRCTFSATRLQLHPQIEHRLCKFNHFCFWRRRPLVVDNIPVNGQGVLCELMCNQFDAVHDAILRSYAAPVNMLPDQARRQQRKLRNQKI